MADSRYVSIRGFRFQKSSFSWGGGDKCVGVARSREEVLVTNTNTPGPVVSFTMAEWNAFLAGVKAGEFDIE